MFGFIIKKNFCDGWDNLLSVVVTNLIFLFVGFGLVYLNLYAMRVHLYLIYVSFPITCIIFSILVFAFGDLAAKIANFEGIHLLDYFKNMENVNNAFIKYVKLLPDDGLLVVNVDNKYCRGLHNYTNAKVVSYAIDNEKANFVARNIHFNKNGFPNFDVYNKYWIASKF